MRLKQFWGYYLVLTASVDTHFDPLFVNPLCDGTVTTGREHRFFTLVILAVFRAICTRFRIQAADLHKWLFSLIKPGLDCATFVRSMSVSSTTSVTAERFHLWPLRRVDVVDLGWAFSGALRQQWRFFYGRFCIPRNFHSFARSRSSCWSTFCFKVWEEHFSTFRSLIIFSKVPKSQDFTSSQNQWVPVQNPMSPYDIKRCQNSHDTRQSRLIYSLLSIAKCISLYCNKLKCTEIKLSLQSSRQKIKKCSFTDSSN